MQKIFIVSFFVVGMYSLIKFIEMKYIKKNEKFKGVKEYVQDAIIIFIASLVSTWGFFTFERNIHEFFNVVSNNKDIVILENVEIFTDPPNF